MNKERKGILSLIFFGLVVIPGTAHSKVICQNSSGELVVRKKCKSGETVFSPNSVSLAIAGSKSAAGAQGLQGQTGQVGPKGSAGPVGLSGPKGATGVKGVKGRIDFSGCRRISGYSSNFSNPGNGVITASLFCNPTTEFLFGDEFVARAFPGSSGTRAFLMAREPERTVIGSEARTTGIYVTYDRFSSAGQGIYELLIEGMCCPN